MICSQREGRRCANGTPSWSKTWQLTTLRYKQKAIYAWLSAYTLRELVNGWLPQFSYHDASSQYRSKIYTISVHLYLVTPAINKHKNQFTNKQIWLRRIQDHHRKGLNETHPLVVGLFCRFNIKNVTQHNSTENDDTKKDPPPLDAHFLELSDSGFGISVAILACW